ncbi:MAG: putative Ig domain-containing protein [Verrucomicrobiaceae bacterium]|nr:putative Ig domain-containing protein [Verrucomicrobiaceae bacterium]
MLRVLLLVLVFLAAPAVAVDFPLAAGYNDGVGAKTYNSSAGTVELLESRSRWIWYLNVSQPGMYAVSVNASASAANAGGTVEVADFVPQHNVPGSKATATLAATHATSNTVAQWQPVGSVWIPAAGLRFLQVRVPQFPGPKPGLIYGLRITGPGVVTASTPWGVRASACDPYFTPSGSTRRAFYGEMVPRPEPTPDVGNTHTVVLTPTGYMGNNDTCFQSLWVSGGQLPAVLLAAGGSRVYTHEGTGSTITLNDFYLDPRVRRKVLNIAVTDGGTGTLTTFLVGEAGQRWHFGGRMRQPTVTMAGDAGFLENPTVGNSQVNWRSCAWGNMWSFGNLTSGAAKSWWPSTSLRGHLRGPSPVTLPTADAVLPYGKVRLRQDMMEMIIGGLIPIAQNDTTFTNVPTTAPELPTLNLAYQLQSRETVNQAAHATVGASYSDTASVSAQIRDPFSTVPFTFQKVSGPSWIAVSSAGALSGTPSVSNEGQNTLIVRATDVNASLSGEFTVGVYVRKAAAAPNAPAFQQVVAQKMTVATVDDVRLIRLPVVDPDSSGRTFSITAGNAGGQFGFSGDWLVKTQPLTAGQTYPLTIQVADNGSPALTASINVEIIAVAATGGVTEDTWFNVAGGTLAEFIADPRYPNSPSQMRLLSSFSESLVPLSTGMRQRAWLTPPTTGSYTFSLSSSLGAVQLRLSTDDTEANLAVVATKTTSTSVNLTAGQRYYIEGLLMNGSDYTDGTVSMRWSGPGITTQTIPASALTPIECATPKLWDGTLTFREVRTGEPVRDHLRTKVETLHLHSALVYQKISGPAWLSIAADGTLSGTPAAGDAGGNTFTVRATAPGGHWDEAQFTLPVITNSAPVIATSTITLSGINEGSEVSGNLATQATDADVGAQLGFGDLLIWSIIAGPPWLGVEPTGELFGKPGAAHIGVNTFTAQVMDRSGATATMQLQITVADIANTPVLSPDPVALTAVGNRAVTASLVPYVLDPDLGETLTFEKLSGPAWLTIAADGTLSGTPLTEHTGTNVFSVRVTDSTARSSTGTVTITVTDGLNYAYEPFIGTDATDVNGTTGGIGWSAAWSGPVDWDFATPGTTFAGLSSAGLKSTMGGQGTNMLRPLAKPVTIGTADGNFEELWLSARMDLNSVTGAGHGIRVTLYNGSTLTGFIGKNINGSLGFDIGGSGFQTLSGSLGTTTGTQGNWLFVLRLLSTSGGTATQINLYAAKDTQINGSLAKLRDPTNAANFPHTASFTVNTPLTFTQLGMYRWNNTASFIDEIRLANTRAQAVPVDMTTAPVFTATPVQRSITTGQTFAASIFDAVTDADTGDVKLFTKLSGPSWLTLSSAGLITGTAPAVAGTQDFDISVTDAANNIVTGTLRIIVVPPNNPPEINPISFSLLEGLSATTVGTLSATDPDSGDTFTYTLVPPVDGPFTIAANGTLSTTAALNYLTATSHALTARVTDSGGLTDEALVTVYVQPTPTTQWRTTYFNSTQLADPNISGPTADPDADGLKNLLEYALGLTPGTADTLSTRVTHDLVNISGSNYLRLSITRNPAATDITLTVEVSSDLTTWTAVPTVIETNTSTSLIVRDIVPMTSAAKRFMRLKVTQ